MEHDFAGVCEIPQNAPRFARAIGVQNARGRADGLDVFGFLAVFHVFVYPRCRYAARDAVYAALVWFLVGDLFGEISQDGEIRTCIHYLHR